MSHPHLFLAHHHQFCHLLDLQESIFYLLTYWSKQTYSHRPLLLLLIHVNYSGQCRLSFLLPRHFQSGSIHCFNMHYGLNHLAMIHFLILFRSHPIQFYSAFNLSFIMNFFLSFLNFIEFNHPFLLATFFKKRGN